mgnify:CR=1 FL=1
MILLILGMLIVSGCVSARTSSNVCPQPIMITENEQRVLKSELPELYLKFTNQQQDLWEIN